MYSLVDEILNCDEREGAKLRYKNSDAYEPEGRDGVSAAVGLYQEVGQQNPHKLGEYLHQGVGADSSDSHEITVECHGQGYGRQRESQYAYEGSDILR